MSPGMGGSNGGAMGGSNGGGSMLGAAMAAGGTPKLLLDGCLAAVGLVAQKQSFLLRLHPCFAFPAKLCPLRSGDGQVFAKRTLVMPHAKSKKEDA